LVLVQLAQTLAMLVRLAEIVLSLMMIPVKLFFLQVAEAQAVVRQMTKEEAVAEEALAL